MLQRGDDSGWAVRRTPVRTFKRRRRERSVPLASFTATPRNIVLVSPSITRHINLATECRSTAACRQEQIIVVPQELAEYYKELSLSPLELETDADAAATATTIREGAAAPTANTKDSPQAQPPAVGSKDDDTALAPSPAMSHPHQPHHLMRPPGPLGGSIADTGLTEGASPAASSLCRDQPAPTPHAPQAAPDASTSPTSALERLLQTVRAAEQTEQRSQRSLPTGYRVEVCAEWSDDRLVGLMAAFAQEDARIGATQLGGRIEWPNQVHILLRERNAQPPEPAGYVWSQVGAGTAAYAVDEHNLPRVHHLFIKIAFRRGQLGRKLLAWWRAEHALRVEAFAVTKPNEAMCKLLVRNGCSHVVQRSGFEGGAQHFHGPISS